MQQVDVAIVGGGVIGTALACELSSRVSHLVLLEKMPRTGMMTSTRNSGVLHGGVYYPPDSLKARFALPGNLMTQHFCRLHDVPMRNCGKLIVAASLNEIPQLEKLQRQGEANGVNGLRIVGADRIRRIEPHISSPAALEVPTSCVVDGAALIQAYVDVAAGNGARVLTGSSVTALTPRSASIAVTVQHTDATAETIDARCVINAAGLYADEVARLLEPAAAYRIYPLRGEYARVVNPAKKNLVNTLVYPLPHNDVLVRDATSRRVHLTRTIHGELLIGPTAKYVNSKEDYDSNRLPLEHFYEGIHWLLPQLELADIELAHAGIRPQRIPPSGQGKSDYIIERGHASPRMINLIGMETPGLTAAPAVAQYVASMVAETLA